MAFHLNTEISLYSYAGHAKLMIDWIMLVENLGELFKRVDKVVKMKLKLQVYTVY